MSEHVHEWRRYIDHDRYCALFICKISGCAEAMTMEEAEPLLNATERLSAVDAHIIASRICRALGLAQREQDCIDRTVEAHAAEAENAALKGVRDGLLWLNNNIDHYGSEDFLEYLKAAIQDALLTAEESE